MCGRFGFYHSSVRAARRIGARPLGDTDEPARFNIAPTQDVLAAVNDEVRGVTALRWGLVPPWASDPAAIRLTTFNARIETIATARTYASALREKRCAIFADHYYEWQIRPNAAKRPLLVRRGDGEPFVFAGLWERWRWGERHMTSCTIVTQPANAFVGTFHTRMPVVLHDDRVADWLAPEPLDAATALEILVPQRSQEWEAYGVSPRVGNVRNDDPSLVERVEDEPRLFEDDPT